MTNWRERARRVWGAICRVTIEPAFFLVSLGSGLADTATKVLLYDKVCIMLISDVNACVTRNLTSSDEILVQQQVSYWDFYRLVSYCIPAMIMNVIYANLSDRWSKKYTMIFYPAGSIVSHAIYIVCAVFIASSPAYMLLSTLVIGISGSMLTLLGACFSYLSAIVPEGNLIIHISIAEAVLLVSSSISSFASGVLLDEVGYVNVYIISIPFYVLTIIYVLVRLKNIPPTPVAKEPEADSTDANLAPPEAPLYVGNEIIGDDRMIIQPELISTHQSSSPAFAEIAGVTSSHDGKFRPEENPLPSRDQLPFASINADLVETASGELSVTCDLSPPAENYVIYPDTPVHSSSSQVALLPDSSSESMCSPCSSIFRILGSYFKDYFGTVARRRELRKRNGIIAILCIILIELFCAHAAGSGLSYLFVIQEPLSWSTAVYGYYTGTSRIVKGVCFLVILPLAKILNIPYAIIIIVSLTSSIIGHTIFALSIYTWMAFLSVAFSLFGSASIVTARSFIVKFIYEDEHGKAFGLIASLETLGTLLSSAIFNMGIYPATVEIFSGLAILIASLLLLIPLSVAIWLHFFYRNMTRLQSNLESQDSVENH